MSIFGTILSKLGFGEDKKEAAPAPATTATPKPVPTAENSPATAPASRPAVVAVSQVDVVSKLESLADANPETLNWKVSIVDLLKLLDLDSSLSARKELAKELGCPDSLMKDSAQMNMWLHKAVLHKLAQNGGNVPADMLN